MLQKVFSKSKVILLHYKKMGFWNASDYIIQRIYKREKLLLAKIKNSNLQIFLRNNKYDTQIFTQIFLRDELDINLKETPKVIIDGGANIGLATLYLKNKFPSAIMIAIEPEFSNFKLLLRNTKSFSHIFCLNKAIWNKSSVLKITDTGNGNASFITEEIDRK